MIFGYRPVVGVRHPRGTLLQMCTGRSLRGRVCMFKVDFDVSLINFDRIIHPDLRKQSMVVQANVGRMRTMLAEAVCACAFRTSVHLCVTRIAKLALYLTIQTPLSRNVVAISCARRRIRSDRTSMLRPQKCAMDVCVHLKEFMVSMHTQRGSNYYFPAP